MKSKFPLFIIILATILIAAACRKKPDPIVASSGDLGSLNIEFTNVVGTRALNLGTSWYTNAAGDSFQIITYNYYISNIVLSTQDGSTFTEPESYHLVEQNNPATWSFKINDLPAGDYTSMKFMIGVDSAQNVNGAHTGDLSPSRGMIWNWNTGYVMAKMEGYSPKSPNPNSAFYYHIAGFKAGESVLKTVSLSFPEAATVTAATNTGVHIYSDAAQWFTSPNLINISTTNSVQQTGRAAMNIAANYADMFTVDHIDH